MQPIFPYWDVPEWTTKPSAMMVKYLFGKYYANGVAVTTTLEGGNHGMLEDLMLAALYAMVSRTLLSASIAHVLTIPPTATHYQITLYKCKQK